MNRISLPLDNIGIFASILCMIHCIATPFIFISKACSAICCSEAPSWWLMIDYIFLIVSFLTILLITRNLTIIWLKTAFWISWGLLLLVIANHSINIIDLSENVIYLPSIAIILLHVYNLQFCKCQNEKCCVNSTSN